jgi:hypothetical protein
MLGGGLRHTCTALGRKRGAGVCRRCPIEQRTTNDYCGWSLESDGAYCKNDDEVYSPEPRTGNLDKERVIRIFSVRMREVIFTEGIAEDIRECKGAKQKVVQEGCLGLKERRASNLRVNYLNLTQVWTGLR